MKFRPSQSIILCSTLDFDTFINKSKKNPEKEDKEIRGDKQ
jgi:hypothetical protein